MPSHHNPTKTEIPRQINASVLPPPISPLRMQRREQVLFSVKFVPAERVKYAGACEIACGSEMRFAREGNEFYFTSTEGRYFTIHKVNYITFGGAEYFTRHGSFSVLMRFKIEDLKGSGRESPPAAGAGGASELRLTEESATRLMSSCPLFDFANKDSFFLVGGIIPTRG